MSCRADAAWCMARPDHTYLVYTMAGRAAQLDLPKVSGSYSVTRIDDADGPAQASRRTVSGGRIATLELPAAALGRPWVASLSRAES